MKAKISEIFKSVQGEGKYAGVNQVFVRFYGCNIHCVWCDTPNSIGDKPAHYDEFSVEQLAEDINRLADNCHSVSLTGGEPMVQAGIIKDLLPLIKETSLKTYLETNGIYFEELKDLIEDLDIIAMDLKLPSSTKCQPFWKEHEEFLKVACQKDVFIKTVISSETSKEDILRSCELVSKFGKDILFILQPNYFDMKNGVLLKCSQFQEICLKHLNDVRIVPQMHKFMKLR